jgi:uncharacterized repeat protein (TIGR03803 family)
MPTAKSDCAPNDSSPNPKPARVAKLASSVRRIILTIALLSALLPLCVRSAQAQTETVLYNFTGGADGATPESALIFDREGNLYGTTAYGGAGSGTVFRLSRSKLGWSESVLHAFVYDTDGGFPDSSLLFDKKGDLYGTTPDGGADLSGVVFELSPEGKNWSESVLYAFTGGADGQYPTGGVIADPAGNLYGNTDSSDFGESGTGILFKLARSSGGGWTEHVIYTEYGPSPGLTLDASGNIYGVTYQEAFELSATGDGAWTPASLYNFPSMQKDGTYPEAGPVFDQNGNLYGTTFYGGAEDNGTVYQLYPGKWAWKERILHSFTSGIDGMRPDARLALDAFGNLYGTTITGGKYGYGTVFELMPPVNVSAGCYKEVILWNFNGADGAMPKGGLVLDSAGNLYGTTSYGGSHNSGVVFEITP